jgi:hypothetical protein
MRSLENGRVCAPADESSAGGGSGALTQTKQSLKEAAAKIKSGAGEAATRVKDSAREYAAENKAAAADRLGGYGAAMHASAESLEEQDPNIAWFTHRTADRLQQAADYVRGRDFAELRSDAEDFARRHPAVFFGGTFALGLILGNLVKASGRRIAADEDLEPTPDNAMENRPDEIAAFGT